jgi:Short C-terminal domain
MLGKPSKRMKKQLEEKGTRANATVVEIAEKGMAVTSGAEGIVANTEVLLKTHLRVQPENEPEFEVTQRFRYPQLAIPAAGQTVPVIYDPGDHDKIMIDRSPEAQQGAALSSAGIDPSQVGQLMQQAEQFRAQAEQFQGTAAQFRAKAEAQQGAGFGQPTPAQPDPVTQLEKLAKLKESGALTEAEFEAEKAKILGQ